MTPLVTVVVCTNRGPEGLVRTLGALDRQTIKDRLQVVVVDDGAPEDLSRQVEAHDAHLVCHDRNLGLAAARNSGWHQARAGIVAFTDDDCRPGESWAEELVGAFDDPLVLAAGGAVVDAEASGWIGGYHRRRNPLAPLEMTLDGTSSATGRLLVYLRSNLASSRPDGPRRVYSVPGANMAVRRSTLEAVGGFDEGIRFGGEDEDLFFRIRAAHPDHLIWYCPAARVEHDFAGTLQDTLRRARSYGRGNARNAAKHPSWPPTIFPGPIVWLVVAVAAVRRPRLALAALLFPPVLFPRWVVAAAQDREPLALTYPYLQLLEEAASDLGFLPAWRTYRQQFAEQIQGPRV